MFGCAGERGERGRAGVRPEQACFCLRKGRPHETTLEPRCISCLSEPRCLHERAALLRSSQRRSAPLVALLLRRGERIFSLCGSVTCAMFLCALCLVCRGFGLIDVCCVLLCCFLPRQRHIIDAVVVANGLGSTAQLPTIQCKAVCLVRSLVTQGLAAEIELGSQVPGQVSLEAPKGELPR